MECGGTESEPLKSPAEPGGRVTAQEGSAQWARLVPGPSVRAAFLIGGSDSRRSVCSLSAAYQKTVIFLNNMNINEAGAKGAGHPQLK